MKKQYTLKDLHYGDFELKLYIDGKLKNTYNENEEYIRGMIKALESEGWSKGWTTDLITDVEDEINRLEMEIDYLQSDLAEMKDNMIKEE